MKSNGNFFLRLSIYMGFSMVTVLALLIAFPAARHGEPSAPPVPVAAAFQAAPAQSVAPPRPAEPVVRSPSAPVANPAEYLWEHDKDAANLLMNRIAPPPGFARLSPPTGSFAFWLQRLPLKEPAAKVHLFNGQLKGNQRSHVAVIDIDTGSRDFQQCADAIIRLRAEYLYARGEQEGITFQFTSGHQASWTKWSLGERPIVKGSNVSWRRSAQPDTSYASFRKYLDTVFIYSGTASLARDTAAVADPQEMQIGDTFVSPGHPGHAVIVVDMAVNAAGQKVFLLAQSYMPAQDMHIVKNLKDESLSPWYPANFGSRLTTPDWPFKKTELRRFR